MMFEHEVRQDLTEKLRDLDAAHRRLVGAMGAEPLPVADLVQALQLAAATVRDCAVCQENHFGDLIPLGMDTLGETIVALRAAETTIRDVIAALLPASPDAAAS